MLTGVNLSETKPLHSITAREEDAGVGSLLYSWINRLYSWIKPDKLCCFCLDRSGKWIHFTFRQLERNLKLAAKDFPLDWSITHHGDTYSMACSLREMQISSDYQLVARSESLKWPQLLFFFFKFTTFFTWNIASIFSKSKTRGFWIILSRLYVYNIAFSTYFFSIFCLCEIFLLFSISLASQMAVITTMKGYESKV